MLDLLCPGCGSTLAQSPGVVGAAMAGCCRCGGLWLDARGYSLLRSYAVGPASKLFLDKVVRSQKPVRRSAYRGHAPAENACPLCRAELFRFGVAGTDIVGDGCLEDGAFFRRAMARRLITVAAADVECNHEPTREMAISSTVRHARIAVTVIMMLSVLLLSFKVLAP